MTYTLVGQGTAATGSNAASLSPAFPASIAEHDLAFCQFQNFGGTNSRTPSISDAGWTQLGVWQNGTASHGLWYAKVTSASMAAPTVTLTGTGVANDTQLARIVVFRPGSGNFAQPGVTGSTSTNASADSVGPITGITGAAGSLLVMSGGKANDWNGASTAQTGWSKTSTADTESTTGNDAGMFFHYILNYGGGATGNLTVPDDGGTASNGVGLGIIVSFLEAPLKTGSEAFTFADKYTQVSVGTVTALAGLGTLSEGKRVQGFGASDPEGSDSGTLAEPASALAMAPVPGETGTLGEATQLDTGSAASVAGTDSGTLAEAAAIATTGSDSGTLGEVPGVAVTGTEAGTLAEASSATAAGNGTDTGTQGEGVAGIALTGPKDTGTLAESGSVSVTSSGGIITSSDAFALSDKRSQVGVLDKGAPNLGALTDIAGFVKSGSDSGSLAESASVVTPIGGDDYRLNDDRSDIQVFEPGSDGTFAEAAYTLGAALAVRDTGTLVETGTQLLTALFVAASDGGALAEFALVSSSGGPLIVVDQAGFDAGTWADTGYYAQSLTASDSGTLAEATSLAVGGSSTPSDRDAFVMPLERGFVAADATGREAWALAEAIAVPADGFGREAGSWAESGYLDVVTVGSDALAVLELPVLDTGQLGIVMGDVSLHPRLTGGASIDPRLDADLSIYGDT